MINERWSLIHTYGQGYAQYWSIVLPASPSCYWCAKITWSQWYCHSAPTLWSAETVLTSLLTSWHAQCTGRGSRSMVISYHHTIQLITPTYTMACERSPEDGPKDSRLLWLSSFQILGSFWEQKTLMTIWVWFYRWSCCHDCYIIYIIELPRQAVCLRT